MSESVRIVGGFISPYVRKVLACLNVKGIPYEIDPIIPFFGNDEFSRISPLRRIPVLIDDRVTLSDSSVICQYLEERYPEPRLFPEAIADRAHARWLEEFADTRMGDVIIWGLFNQLVIRPFVFRQPSDQDVLKRIREIEMPHVLDYLETQSPADGFLFGALSIADISVAAFFRNATFAGYQIDGERWPRTAAFIERVLAAPSFQTLLPIEDRLIRTPPSEHRATLAEMGIPLTATTYGTTAPRPGIMKT